ncbi:helix-turn-helix domain-containing protein [Streptomyces sp. LBUM 1486]|uniref:helix-turn-helix domain-containing protein n=1 Tax=Streptomyces scabiei TaxID=1930 RepID=UPI000996DCAC|nr:helix-turn-helix domain-containing protein [Streptomyces scabiei]MBP5867170.1 helix-turn-helix domain-containing protein [Streptomyces sp. LBUM 1485]MBP5917049.1 helix-turn-helix domain-containing protein [Streptomyces sp. LBUM 1486]QTU53812.1 helix-turn-helix domain-containing protein [Streptomyces sp. LBUM 1480]
MPNRRVELEGRQAPGQRTQTVRREQGGITGSSGGAAVRWSSRCLSQDERVYIADRVREKVPVRAIAVELGRSPSTVSREIRRNRTTGTPGQWHHRPVASPASGTTALRRSSPLQAAAAPAPSPGRSTRTPSCGSSSRPAWTAGGARNSHAMLSLLRPAGQPAQQHHQTGQVRPVQGDSGPPVLGCGRGRSRATGRGACRPGRDTGFVSVADPGFSRTATPAVSCLRRGPRQGAVR